MTLLLRDAQLAARREVVVDGAPLAPLAASLARDLEPLLSHDLHVPAAKALLSREGGRCPADGSLLEFDPWSPHAHRCPACGRVYAGEYHDRFWIHWYQLWLAERAVHAALLAALGAGDRYARLGRDILLAYVDRYARYPNVDNVLGPTRVFFSTYLESIWLLQLCVAADLLAFGGDAATRDTLCDRVVEPSSDIIAGYDEGASNRQVWNNAALLAAALLRGRPDDAERVVFGESGLVYHLGAGLLADGTWYEGENYHQFAHRGLWYGVVMAENAGIDLPAPLWARFQEGFATSFVTALPDFTLPSRRDSQYAISLRQWRYAEQAELGLARADDDRLVGALHRMYAADLPPGDTGRSRSSAEAERNAAPVRLTRADLGWRSLLHARAELPPLHDVPARSALLPAQGLAILRRDDARLYAALDYGHSGGGHGHPDRLDVMLAHGGTRWLDDPGTGSYVDPSLHWYRSTLAHNAPLVNGHSQERVHGRLLAWDDRGDHGWVRADVSGIAPGVVAERTLVVMPAYLIDEIVWRADHDVSVDLPVHLAAEKAGVGRMQTGTLTGGHALEDGFDFLVDALVADVDAGKAVPLEASTSTGDRLRAWCASDRETEWWRAIAPGPPGKDPQPFWVLRTEGADGAHRFVYCWTDEVVDARFGDGSITVVLRDGTTHVHRRADDGWRMEAEGPGGATSVALRGIVAEADRIVDAPIVPASGAGMPSFHKRKPQPLAPGHALAYKLGERHYARSEQTWADAGKPAADVALRWDGRSLSIAVDVHVGGRPLTFAPADERNPYDNEHPDVNGDGIELFVRTAGQDAGWMLVPERGSNAVRVRSITGGSAEPAVVATWTATDDGYRVEASVPLGPVDDRHLALDVLVNEMPPGRERRRGQLALSGGRGRFVYLRGDRHDPAALLPFTLIDA